MRRVLVRGVLAAIALGLVWLFSARQIVTLIDRVHTVRVAALASDPIGWNGTYLQFGAAVPGLLGPQGWTGTGLLIGGHILDLEGPGPEYHEPVKLTVDDQGGLVATLASGGHLILGRRAGTMPGADDPIPAYAAEPGDIAALVIEQSLLSWPIFWSNHSGYLDGPASTWQRNFYYRLSWKKRSGEQLDLLWRFEQGYESINGWTAAGGSEDGVTGLISAELHPAP